MSKEAWDYLRANFKTDGKGRHNTTDAMKVACHYADEVARLKEKCDRQAMILRRLTPENHPDTYFIHGDGGTKDINGMPERLYVVPAYGCDWSQVYVRTDKVTGPEW